MARIIDRVEAGKKWFTVRLANVKLCFMEQVKGPKKVLLTNEYVTVPVIGAELSGDCPELNRVLEMSNYLAKVKGLQEILDNSLLKMMQQFNMEYGRIYLLNEAGDRLVLVSSQGIVVAGLESMGINEGFSGKATRSGCFLAQRISDMENQERAALLASRGLESVVCLPLIAMDNTLGVMNLAASRLIELDPTTIDLMVVLGNLIAVSILNARQAEALEQKARAMEAQKEAIRFFAYTASHDLKSPATAINGLARMLVRLGGETMDYRAKEVCAQISKAAAVIEELAGELNSYIKAKEATLEPEDVDLTEVVDLVASHVSGELERRGIVCRTPERPTMVWADKLALLRALQNLVDNALKYGGMGLSMVEIGHQLTSGHHVIYVRDDGVGLDADQQENLFSLFGRGATSKGTAGTGLGLAIVREIAQRHGGQAWLEGRAGQGCTFYFSLKRREAA